MFVIRTDGQQEPVSFDKILEKINSLNYNLHSSVDSALVTQKTIQNMVDGISTAELDNLSASIAANLVTVHPDYAILANRILVSRLHKQVNLNFADNIKNLYEYTDPNTGYRSPRIGERVYEFIQNHAQELQEMLDYQRDFDQFDYFGMNALIKSYLFKMNNKVAETPQQMFLRTACGLWVDNLQEVKKSYEFESQKLFSHGTSILFHSSSQYPQMSNCYLNFMEDTLVGDDYAQTNQVKGIFKSLTDLGIQSKGGGGNGLAIHAIRSKGSYIKKTGGQSSGILHLVLKQAESVMRACNQSGKRKGSCAIYLEPWHADIYDFLDAKKETGVDSERARDLFYAIWMPDLFMKRLAQDKEKAKWTLFDPAIVEAKLAAINEPPLWESYGTKFEQNYEYLESLGVGKTIDLIHLWKHILDIQVTTGMPYMMFKDSINEKSNQKNLGVIKSSNLCSEITLYTSSEETAVCVLGSLVLYKYVEDNQFNFHKLYDVTYQLTKNLNRVIDVQYYPTVETRNSCLKRRAIGIGAQGLADTFHALKLNFTEEKAKQLNKDIFETIYFASLQASCDLAKKDGFYEGFIGSPSSQGILQFDMWNIQPSNRWNWNQLKENIKKWGLRNSEVTALMPTATKSIVMGNCESFEPYSYNLYARRALSGEIKVVNKWLVAELVNLGIWNQELVQKIIYNEGSIQGIDEIPLDIQSRYRTAFEIDWRELINMFADRGAFVSQTQSFNQFLAKPSFDELTQRHFFAWRKGCKQSSYYIRMQSASTGSKELSKTNHELLVNTPIMNIKSDNTKLACSIDKPGECEMCAA